MIVKSSDYQSLAEYIKKTNKRIIVYGAGMIGQVIIPYLIEEYNLIANIECFVDTDKRKTGQKIHIGTKDVEIRLPEYLHQNLDNTVLFVSNSKFSSVLQSLDQIEELNNIEAYIIPVMQIQEQQKLERITIKRLYNKPQIPKKIHYCWFGGAPLPMFLKQCMESWHEYCPDYEIICWNEENYDVSKTRYTKEAYENKKYGFVSDLARLEILYENGGIYFDTDVTVIKNIDDLLYQKGFIGVEKWGNINSGGGCGFVAGHPMLGDIISYRKKYPFVWQDGAMNIETNGIYETIPFLKNGYKPDGSMQIINEVTVYPSYVFHPYDYLSCDLHKEDATVSIHHFYGGWMDTADFYNRKKTQDEYRSGIKN